MLQSLNFKHVFYFWVVARESSVSKASTLLNVSQSSISEQIKILESRIGVVLFDRTNKKMQLSQEGKVLFKALDDFFPSVEELFESLSNHKTTDVKFLRIGLSPALSPELRFKLCFSLIEDIHYTVKIVQGENEFLVDAFNRDDIDMIFTTNNNLSVNGKYEKIRLAKKEFVIVMNKNMIKKIKSNKLIELNDLKYINYTPDTDHHFHIINFLHKHNLSPTRIAEIDDIGLIKETLYRLDCFAVLPIKSISEDIAKKKLFIFKTKEKMIETNITAIYKSKFSSSSFDEHLEHISKSITSID